MQILVHATPAHESHMATAVEEIFNLQNSKAFQPTELTQFIAKRKDLQSHTKKRYIFRCLDVHRIQRSVEMRRSYFIAVAALLLAFCYSAAAQSSEENAKRVRSMLQSNSNLCYRSTALLIKIIVLSNFLMALFSLRSKNSWSCKRNLAPV